LNFIKHNQRLNHFYATFEIKGANHHNQDPYLFSYYLQYPVPIFMDIDLLNLIFRSKRNIMNMKKNETVFDKVKSHEFSLKIIRHLAPELNDVPFGKNGYYTINEYFSNRFILYLKRFFRNKFENDYPANFRIGGWMKRFIEKEIANIDSNQHISHLFNLNHFKRKLNLMTSNPEKDWLKFSSIVTLEKISRKYL